MPQLDLILNAEGEFPNMKALGDITKIGRLPKGMASRKSSVVIEVTQKDGTVSYGETSLALLAAAVRAFMARDEVENLPAADS